MRTDSAPGDTCLLDQLVVDRFNDLLLTRSAPNPNAPNKLLWLCD